MTNVLHAVCSVCFRFHNLNTAKGRTDKPIRHGFHVVGGNGQGHAGSWHTAACNGVTFPHFGVSTLGTKWALGEIMRSLEAVVSTVERLDTQPELTWTYQPKRMERTTGWGAKIIYVPHGEPIMRKLVPGVESERISYEVLTRGEEVVAPSYKQEWSHRMADAVAHRDALIRERTKYETAIATWVPVAAVPGKAVVAIVHKQADLAKGARPSCNRMMSGFKAAVLATKGLMTKDDSLVTCARCAK